MAVTDKFNEEWNGFKGRLWKEEVNTRQFIQDNYKPYDGDESFLAGPTAERMRDYRAGKKKSQDPEPEKKPEGSGKTKRNEYAVAFEEFWKVYPRKVDKGNAYKKYQARLNDGYSDAVTI